MENVDPASPGSRLMATYITTNVPIDAQTTP